MRKKQLSKRQLSTDSWHIPTQTTNDKVLIGECRVTNQLGAPSGAISMFGAVYFSYIIRVER